MAKRKKSIDLIPQQLSFCEKEREYKLLRFYPDKMVVDVMVYEGLEKIGLQELPYAHLPKKLKKTIKPN